MKLLALDTSSVACTVAVQHGDEVFERYEAQPREHTRLLIPMIRSILADADVELSELDGIVLGNGTGSTCSSVECSAGALSRQDAKRKPT